MKHTSIYLFLVSLGLFGTSVFCQSEVGKDARLTGLRYLEVGKALATMPEAGNRAEDFVPKHWIIYSRADGDMNADGLADTAMILTLDEKDTKYIDSLKRMEPDDDWIGQTFMIVFIDTRLGDRKPHFADVNYVLGSRPQDQRDEFKVSIKKNVLDVYIDVGGSMRTEMTYHFREDPPAGGFLSLIGYDEEHNSVTNDDADAKWSVSENYLTNTRIDTTYKSRGGNWIPTEKRSSIKPQKIRFGEATL